MSRLAQAFARTKEKRKAAFVAYLCAGDPDFASSLAACRGVIEAGADVLELGVPFSDPLADGLTNQLAAQRALESGITPTLVLDLVRAIRAFSEIPVVLYTYYNLVFTNGVEHFVAAAAAAGVDGILTLDLPPEESGELAEATQKHGIDIVTLVAPTTPESRLPIIAAAASGFIYYVSREGVTGVRDSVAVGIPDALARIRRHTSLPIAVGFGIATRAHVSDVAAHADGVVVGSALVNTIRDNLGHREAIGPALKAKVSDLVLGTSRN